MASPEVGRRLRWWISWALLFGIAALWSLSEPILAGPDEPSHVIKAAALVRGQLTGRDRLQVVEPGKPPPKDTLVKVPEVVAGAHLVPKCYALSPAIPADCAPAFSGSHREVTGLTTAGHYPPLYYAAVGLPIRIWPSVTGLYLMRLLGAALCAAFLASAVESAVCARHRAALLVGTALAMTPMVFFVSSIVNPSALEIAAALSLWVSLIVVVLDLGPGSGARLLTRVGVAGGVFVLTRGISPLWLVVIGSTLLVAARPGAVRGLLRRRDVRLCAVAVGLATAAALGWTLFAGSLQLLPTEVAPESTAAIVRHSIGKTEVDLRQMVGSFGSLDVQAPALTQYVWIGGVGGLVGAALALGRRRHVVALVALVAAVVVVPVVLESLQADDFGFFWQGRYTLPLAMGVPLLAAFAVSDRLPLPTRLLSVVVAAAAVGHVLAYANAIRRFSVGHKGPIMYMFSDRGWDPPFPSTLLLGAMIVATAALACWLRLLVRVPSGEQSDALVATDRSTGDALEGAHPA